MTSSPGLTQQRSMFLLCHWCLLQGACQTSFSVTVLHV